MPRLGELCFLSVEEASRLLRSKRLSPVELVRSHVERIEQVDRQVRAYVTLVAEQAMADARRAEAAIMRGDYLGPLHGIPYALKDLFDTKGIRTTGQSRVMEHRVPRRDATAVKRLKDAGAIMLGKLAMYEFAIGGPATSLFEPARNPWNLDHMTGGSSSGSGAAIAAGLCMVSLGSDTGGSIRGPAAHCGMVGFKPTYGLVSRHGVIPLSWSLDHCGPMARTVADAAVTLQVIAGHDEHDLTSIRAPVPDFEVDLGRGVRGLTVGVPRRLFDDVSGTDAECLGLVEEALRVMAGLGAKVREVSIPLLRDAQAAVWPITCSERFAFHRRSLLARPQDYGESARMHLYMGALYTASDYILAQRVRASAVDQFVKAMDGLDALVTPTAAKPPGMLDAGKGLVVDLQKLNFTRFFNLTGAPAISVPCGFTKSGLPVGLQVAGKPQDDAKVLRIAHAYEQAAGWFAHHPKV